RHEEAERPLGIGLRARRNGGGSHRRSAKLQPSTPQDRHLGNQLAPPSFSSASTTAQVLGPTTPSTARCARCCRSFTAASVFGLKRPSTPPVSKPTAVIRLCSRRT